MDMHPSLYTLRNLDTSRRVFVSGFTDECIRTSVYIALVLVLDQGTAKNFWYFEMTRKKKLKIWDEYRPRAIHPWKNNSRLIHGPLKLIRFLSHEMMIPLEMSFVRSSVTNGWFFSWKRLLIKVCISFEQSRLADWSTASALTYYVLRTCCMILLIRIP